MKILKFITVIVFLGTLFMSCSNNASDDELQMHIDNNEMRADGTGGENPPAIPPPPPE